MDSSKNFVSQITIHKEKTKFPNTQVEETWMFQHPITHQIGKINSQQKGNNIS